MSGPVPPQDSPRAGAASGRRFVGYLASAGELVAARRFREAEIEVLRALSGGPANLRALNLLALVRFKLGRLEEARATYREIAAVAPKDAGVRRNLGLLALKAERFDEAVPELELAARLAPGDRRAWSYLGYAYTRRGEMAAAVEAFRRAGQEAIARELQEKAQEKAQEQEKLQEDKAQDSARPAAGAAAQPAPAAVEEELPREEPSALVPRAQSQPDLADAAAVFAPVLAPVFAQPAVARAPFTMHAPVPVPVVSFALAALGLGPIAGFESTGTRRAPVRLLARGGVHVRAGAALASVGTASWEPALRRIRGRRSGETLGSRARPFYRLDGDGEVWVAGPANRHVELALDDDILYVREERVLAFDAGVSWEAGRVPGDRLRMLQFRGRGRVVLQLSGPPVAVRVSDAAPAQVARTHLLGWVGRIVARKGRTGGPLPIECEGEGVILLEAPAPKRRTARKTEGKTQGKTARTTTAPRSAA